MARIEIKRTLSEDLPPEDVDTIDRLQQIQSRDARERQERNLRQWYAIAIMALLTLQLIFVAIVVLLIGFEVMTLDRWVATTLIAGMLSEVAGMAYLVVRYLFPPPFRG